MKHDEYEKGVVRIEDTLANQTQELDELSKLSTIAFNRNTVLEREVQELKKRLTTAKSELQVCNIMYYTPIMIIYYCDDNVRVLLCMHSHIWQSNIHYGAILKSLLSL